MPGYQVSRDNLVVNTTNRVCEWVLYVPLYRARGLGGTCSSQGHVDTTSSVGSCVLGGADWARVTLREVWIQEVAPGVGGWRFASSGDAAGSSR